MPVASVAKNPTLTNEKVSPAKLSRAEEFDEAAFIQTLKQTVEADLIKRKAKIVNSELRDKTSFSIEYAFENTSGKVEISGKQFPQNYYSLESELAERVDHAQ